MSDYFRISIIHRTLRMWYSFFACLYTRRTSVYSLTRRTQMKKKSTVWQCSHWKTTTNNNNNKIPQFRQWACQKWPYSTKALLSGIFRWTYLTPNCLRKDGADWKLDPKTVRYWEAGEGREALAKRHTTLSPPEWFLHQNRQQWMSFQCFVQCVGQSQKTASINDNFSRGSRTEAWALFAAILNAGVTLVVTV